MCSDKNGSDFKYSKMDTGVSAEMIQETLDIIDVLTPTGRQSGSIAALFDKEWQKFHKTLH